jgi:hypothetical protein
VTTEPEVAGGVFRKEKPSALRFFYSLKDKNLETLEGNAGAKDWKGLFSKEKVLLCDISIYT